MEGTQPLEKKLNLCSTDLFSVPRSSKMQTCTVIHDNTHIAGNEKNKQFNT